jgi:hypothetical protein
VIHASQVILLRCINIRSCDGVDIGMKEYIQNPLENVNLKEQEVDRINILN